MRRKNSSNHQRIFSYKHFSLAISHLVILISIFSLSSCNHPLKLTKEEKGLHRKRWIERKIRNMSQAEKIGQLLLISLPGKRVTAQLKKRIERLHAGGVLLFQKNISNIEATRTYLHNLQSIALKQNAIPLILTTDQEFGRVVRLKKAMTPFPSQYIFSRNDDTKLTKQIATITALELGAYGLNLNLAPVVDVNNNPQNPVINIRSFSQDPKQVGRHAVAYIKGFAEAGLGTTVKHFPGHGDTNVDSHKGLPIIQKQISDLKKIELPPFRSAILAGADAVMTAHILFPSLDAQLPATMSRKIITRLLREELKYQGPLMSDDLIMGAVGQSLEKAGVLKFVSIRYKEILPLLYALNADVDLLIYTAKLDDLEESVKLLIEYCQKGRQKIFACTEENLDKKLRRILRLKYDLLFSKKIMNYKNFQSLYKKREDILHKSHLNGLKPILTNQRELKIDFSLPAAWLDLSGKLRNETIVKWRTKYTLKIMTSKILQKMQTDMQNQHRYSALLISLYPHQLHLLEQLLNRKLKETGSNGLPIIVSILARPFDNRDYSKTIKKTILNRAIFLQSTGYDNKQLYALLEEIMRYKGKNLKELLQNNKHLMDKSGKI